ncbi:MAG: hypothetical protein EOM66_00760 [Clostridia bacterium]|nr:hypothetical protein [Clostridia bacterium]
MDFSVISEALSLAFTPMSMLYASLGVILGVTVAAIPGLTGDMAIAVLLPLVYKVDPLLSLGLLVGIYKGSMFGGSISAIAFGVPGTPAAAATVEDGYPLKKKGFPRRAMMQALYSSVTGDVFSTILLMFLTVPLARIAILFGPVELFSLYVFSLAVIAMLNRESPVRGLIACLLGLAVSCVGVDGLTGSTRMWFGIKALRGGISNTPLLIGLFAVSELIIQFGTSQREKLMVKLQEVSAEKVRLTEEGYDPKQDRYKLVHYIKTFWATLLGSLIGTFVGILPGAGSSIACYLSYGVARRVCKDGDRFGTGVLNGVAAPEAGNSATAGASIIPLLAFGIPGSATAALIGAALSMQGFNPGPTLIAENKLIMFAFFIICGYASILNLGFSHLLIPVYTKIAMIKKQYLVPVIFVLATLGIYTTSNSMVDVWIVLGAGLVGILLKKFRVPLGPFVLGALLGSSTERSLRQALAIGKGSWRVLFSDPIAIGFYVATILFFFFIAYTFRANKKELDKGAYSDDD